MVLKITLISNSKINIVTKIQVSNLKNDEFKNALFRLDEFEFLIHKITVILLQLLCIF